MKLGELADEPKVVAHVNTRLGEILSKMKEENQWVVPVLKEKKVVAMLTDKNLIRRAVSLETRVFTIASPTVTLNENDDFGKVVAKFYTSKARAIPLVNSSRELVGLVTRENVLNYLLESGEIPNAKAREYMSSPPIMLSSSDSVAKARWEIVRNHVSRIPVVNEKNLEGIVTTRDIVNALYSVSGRKRESIMAEEERIMAMPLKDIMVYPVITVNGADSLSKVAEKIVKNKISGMPVMEGDYVAGVISGIDVIKSLESKYQLSLPLQAKLTTGLRNAEIKSMIDGVLERYLSKLEKLTEIINFRVSFKEEAVSQDKTLYKVTVNATTKIGNFVANETDWDPVVAVKKAVEKVEERLIRKLKRIEEKKVDKREEI
ncbi:MAG: signal-transduction protein [Candidatus Aramenus sulfurataquae]|uniref:CBS domain-containing protein n=2 Tax=Candidatus Aramenus sulfurataquae TaxID=1326980 RepID=W7KI37_9CREN|nr:MAG: signal-transduction protein [Candidatus Aramenus sulfurataquae]MCL7343554.1 CBS domain-containing protein [Candidatus Aramenus sulfurataquae]